MSHRIEYWNQPADKEKKEIREEIFWLIYDAVECEYPNDQPSYCNMGVKYKDDNGQLMYLIRTEYHC